MIQMKKVLFKDKSRELIVVTSTTKWDEIPRVRHQVTQQLTKYYNVIYLELPVLLNQSSLGVNKVDENLFVYKSNSNTFSHKIISYLWMFIPGFNTIINCVYSLLINRIVNNSDYSKYALFNFQYNFTLVFVDRKVSKLIYFCNDDFQGNINEVLKKKINSYFEKRTIRRADICFSVSSILSEKIYKYNKNVHTILPGHYFTIDAANYKEDRSSKQLSVCYMGVINNRIDFETIYKIIENNTIDIFFIGPVEDINTRFFDSFPNVHFLGTLINDVLKDTILKMDVCIVPHKITLAGAQATNAPNKLFQYLACGKPVVTINYPNLISFPESFIYTAASPQVFVDKIFKAYNEDSLELQLSRIKFSAKHHWNKRGELIMKLLQIQ
jgi:glycosyltransferase involved in cell wall biosynthesis